MPVVVAEQDKPSTAAGLTEVIRMTQELFSSPVAVEQMSDPEAPNESWTVLSVEATGDVKELVKRRCEWHERLARQFPGHAADLRLSIGPRP